jgi:hypothetical protein
LIVTAGWLSSAVEKVCANLVGMVVFFWIIFVITPPRVSMPSESGVTSSSSTSLRSPASTWPWIAAPTATGLIGVDVLARLLAEELLDLLLDLGHARLPPTRITSSIWLALTPASLMAVRHGAIVRSIRSSTSASSLARVSLMFRCFGPRHRPSRRAG